MNFRITLIASFICITLSFAFLPYPWGLLTSIGLLLLAGAVFSYGVIAIRWGFFFPATGNTSDGKVLLTFDDGPDPTGTPKILEILKRFDTRAIFFLIGEKAEAHPELVKAILADGHWIANHTYSHPLFFSLKNGKFVEREINACDAVISSFNPPVRNLFRPPVGYLNPIIARKLRKLNKRVIAWSLRSFDTVLPADKLLSRLLEQTAKGDIVLLHDTQPATKEILAAYIESAKATGIQFVSAPEKSLPI